MNWKITYYSEKVQQETFALPKGVLAMAIIIKRKQEVLDEN